jgi:hypothetical protein
VRDTLTVRLGEPLKPPCPDAPVGAGTSCLAVSVASPFHDAQEVRDFLSVGLRSRIGARALSHGVKQTSLLKSP